MLITYYGRHDAVDLPLPDGRLETVKRGGSVDVPEVLARSLLEQAANWGPKRSPKADAPPAPPKPIAASAATKRKGD